MSTIYALATTLGKSGVAVFRVSGPAAGDVIIKLTKGGIPETRKTVLRKIYTTEGELIDEVLLVYFSAPNSFTGQDVVELHCHGSPAVIQMITQELSFFSELRLAKPGEFSRLALENGKLSLSEIEGLSDLINSETRSQQRQAARAFSGDIDRLVALWRSNLVQALALIEAQLDFSDEDDISKIEIAHIIKALNQVQESLATETKGISGAERIRNGYEIAIMGSPNSGKSTLINYIAKKEIALVSDVPGTTRDILEARMDLRGLLVTFLDTAGQRETDDRIEKLGVEKAKSRAKSADIRIWLLDSGEDKPITIFPEDIIVRGKADIDPSGEISGLNGHGVEQLLDQIAEKLSNESTEIGSLVNNRHRKSAEQAMKSLKAAKEELSNEIFALELVSANVHQALMHLDELVGKVGVEDVLDELFSQFCIGK